MANKIQLASFDELFGQTAPNKTETKSNTSQVTEIELEKLIEFKDHPFQVRDDDEMDKLMREIIDFGGLANPIVVRPKGSHYEILSGHRRKRAYEKLGYKTIPCYIKELSDKDATLVMAYSNEQREVILPSERAKEYKMVLDALKDRKDTKGHCVPTPLEASIIKALDLSKKSLFRYAKLNDLIPDMMRLVDNKFFAVMVGFNLSYLKADEQTMLLNLLDEKKVKINLKTSEKLKELSENKNFKEERVKTCLYGVPKSKRSISINDKKLKEYFPPEYTKKDIEETIYKLLDEWRNKNEKA